MATLHDAPRVTINQSPQHNGDACSILPRATVLTTESRRPSEAIGLSDDRRSSGRLIVGGARDVSLSPPAFGDGKSSYYPGIKTATLMNKPLIINEGGQRVKKQSMEVPGKGKKKLLEDNLEKSGWLFKKQKEKEIVMIPSSTFETFSIEVGKEEENKVNSDTLLRKTIAVNEPECSVVKKKYVEESNSRSDLEEVRACSTGELGRFVEVLEEMPKRPNPGSLQNAWSRNKIIRFTDLDLSNCIAEDGVKLHMEKDDQCIEIADFSGMGSSRPILDRHGTISVWQNPESKTEIIVLENCPVRLEFGHIVLDDVAIGQDDQTKCRALISVVGFGDLLGYLSSLYVVNISGAEPPA
ncbi:hypothetical protein MA16_Dca006596 [Dendrobium catenatum]|uniref:Uncharacterized protein n=1 Tax=Dendrobium catenatum TaxID=906689 RepID=A0A2I0X5M0_9ASPA|nr:hypothetical protein MA16_Dca006596 [Dendrobium catenatum]